MKTKTGYLPILLALSGLVALNFPSSIANGQGTAFSYQGHFNDGTNWANGNYDLRFALFDAVSGGGQAGVTLTNQATAVSNGLFNVTLDFGGVFTGTAYWMEIAARTNGNGAFITLTPRQALTPTPYAIFANTASNLSGSLPAGQISGTISDSALSANIPRLNGSATFSGTVAASGFSGSGSGLTSLNASQLSSGTVPAARFSGNYSVNTVTISNLADSFGGNALYIGNNRIGGWPNSIVKFENTAVLTTSNAPALRVVNDGGTNNDGALSVSANVQPGLADGIIAEFGNANAFVTVITNDGTIYASGFVGKGTLNWQVIPGSAVQAASNTGYLLAGGSLTTLTLPASPSVGDVIRVSGGGSGGWRISQNAGQSIVGSFSNGTTTTSGAGGYLTGVQLTVVELQYIGGGQFASLSQEGALAVH